MPLYRYRAVQSSGLIHSGTLRVAHEGELGEQLGGRGLEVIEARVVKGLPFRRREGAAARVNLCEQLHDLLQAGVPFLLALKTVADTLPQGSLRDRVEGVAQEVSHGAAVSAAFRAQGDLFGPVFLAMLAAGEASGDLAATFGHLARQARRQQEAEAQLRRALRYPLFLLAVALGVTIFMLTLVVPQLVAFLKSLASELPWPTRLLIAVSEIVATGWWIAALALGAALGIAALWRRLSEAFALNTDAALLRLPLVGVLLRRLAVARFAHSLAVLVNSGLDLPESLRLAASTLGNRALFRAAQGAEQAVQAGQPLSEATHLLFPSFVTPMLRIGEQSGHLTKALAEAARHCEQSARAAIERMLGALEPALTILVGSLLAWTVLAVLGPVYGSLGRVIGN